MMEFDESQTHEELIDKIVINDIELCIDNSINDAQMLRVIKKHVVRPANELLKTVEYVSKVTLFSNRLNNSSRVVILFSVSHVPADGYTYYKWLNSFFEPSQMNCM